MSWFHCRFIDYIPGSASFASCQFAGVWRVVSFDETFNLPSCHSRFTFGASGLTTNGVVGLPCTRYDSAVASSSQRAPSGDGDSIAHADCYWSDSYEYVGCVRTV